MKDFMLIFIGEDYSDLGLSPEEIQGRMGKWMAWSEKMEKQGIVKGGEALHPGGRSIKGNERTVSDGPFAEGKELVGGFFIVTAKDYDAAVEIAQDFPDYDLGSVVEVIEVMVFDQ